MNITEKLHAYIDNRPVYVLGVSTEGESTARFLLSHGISLTICDKKSENELGEVYKTFKKMGAEFRLGRSYLQSIKPHSFLFRTPGMSAWLPEINHAKNSGATLTNHIQLFFSLCSSKIIGVTGTKGKGTTTTLIESILKASGNEAKIGGNIGNPPLNFIDMLTHSSSAVLELSSFQLEDVTHSPHIAVVLMVTQEHLASGSKESPNFHRNLHEYLQAKSHILKFQKSDDSAIINADYANSIGMISIGEGTKYIYSKTKKVEGAYLETDGKTFQKIKITINKITVDIGDVINAKLPGLHNRENMMAAALASYLLGVNPSIIHNTLVTFPGLEHRLELVCDIGGISYFNDSFSTTPETAIAAIKAFSRPIVLIAGGSDKGSDYTELGRTIVHSTVKSVFMIGQMRKQIKKAIDNAGGGVQLVDMGTQSISTVINKSQHIL